MPSLSLGLRATVVYFTLMSAATVWVFLIGQPPADIIATLGVLAPFQFLATIFCCVFVVRHFGWTNAGFARMNWPALIWFVPAWLVLGVMYFDLSRVLTPADLRGMGGGLVLLVAIPFLIAFAEEVTFRGILLRSALSAMPLVTAMLLSAAVFGLFHLVNVMAGQGLAATAQQIAFAMMAGFFLAPLAIRLGNLWPLIIWHWLWNMAVFLSLIADVMHPLAVVGIAMQTVISIGLWAALISDSKRD